MEDLSRRRWIMIGIGFLIQLVLGLLYAWSVFVLPLENEFGWKRSQTSWAFTIAIISFPVGMFLAGRLIDRRGLRLSGGLGALLLSAGFLLTSFTASVPWLILSYGVLGGLGIGICSNGVASIYAWFPDKRGLAAGVTSMGFGLGALTLGSLTDSAITALGWRAAFRLLAAITLIICFGGFQFLRRVPSGWTPRGWTPPQHNRPSRDNYPPREMLGTGAFWLLELWSLLISTAGVMVIGHIVPMAVELGVEQKTAVLSMGILSLSNGLGRPIFGTLSDRLGRAPTMFLGAALMSVTILSAIPLTRAFGFPGLVAATVLIGSSYGGYVPIVSATILQLFGSEHYGTNLGLSSFQMVVGGLLGPQMAGLLRSTTGTYLIPFNITGVLALGACLAAGLFSLSLKRMGQDTTRPLKEAA